MAAVTAAQDDRSDDIAFTENGTDDLGIIVPRIIPLEIFTDREGEIILKKYSPIGELGSFAKEYAEALSSSSGHSVCITDRDQVIAAAGNS